MKMLKTIVLDPALRAQLNGLSEQMEVRDEQGAVIGMFLPLNSYKRLLGTPTIPLSAEEIERRTQEKGGCSLEEIWRKLGAK
jgi:hypothetical protein